MSDTTLESAAAAAAAAGVRTDDVPPGVDPATGEITGPLGEPAGPAGPAEPEPEPEEPAKKSGPSSYIILYAELPEENVENVAIGWSLATGTWEGDGQAEAKRAFLEAREHGRFRELAGVQRLILAAVPVSSWKPTRPKPREQKITWVV